jgi:transcription elongation factor Elf1
MKDIPDKLERITFVCSACGKRSVSVALNNHMKCQHCGEVYAMHEGEWQSKAYLDITRRQKMV